MVAELLHEMQAEIAHNPLTFVIEVVQFALLVGVVWFVAIGVGKRRGFVTNIVAERRERIASELELADSGEATLENAKQNAETALSEARESAERIAAEAGIKAKDTLAVSAEAADREAEALREHARQLLEMEHAEMLAEARERLLEVVGSATRHILSERLSPAEQRALVQHAIMASLNGGGDAVSTSRGGAEARLA